MTRASYWRGRRVLVTGHTGFKGSWLSAWLLSLGADVHGLALSPETDPALFDQAGLGARMPSRLLDIRDAAALREAVAEIRPATVFHLAAQALVRPSYADPLRTWATNVMGTANLLDAVTALGQPCDIVAVTTDKVYHNEEWVHPYRETDRLGGRDPYSASKAAMELLLASWRSSFSAGSGVRIASARAGNVIGGGDWAADRLTPDIARALVRGEAVQVRNPGSTRPWQHVLEPLDGYLHLAERMGDDSAGACDEAYNFGPEPTDARSVGELVEECLKHWPGAWRAVEDPAGPHEAGRLALSIEKARGDLGWRPNWSFERAVEETIFWYRSAAEGRDAFDLCQTQIARYEESR